MNISGKLLIAGEWVVGEGEKFKGINPATNEVSEENFHFADVTQLNKSISEADKAFKIYSQCSDKEKSTFLKTIAEQLESIRPDIVERATWETALPDVRINGELGRTISQLMMFANLLDKGEWKRPVIDLAQPDRQPLPKPDLRLTQVPLGPVGVFSASNFPLAFSVAGGDTASALAAGCPVIVKTHSAHPGTSELVASAIHKAAIKCSMPKGVFTMLHGNGRCIGSELVKHPQIKAVGFTGSVSGGRALFDIATARPEPIPFFGELGSTNPVFIMPEALESDPEGIASSFLASLTMGVGQFCTSPGIIVAIKGQSLDKFKESLSHKLPSLQASAMLTSGICKSFNHHCQQRNDIEFLDVIGKGSAGNDNQAQATIFHVEADSYLENIHLEEEVFGPAALIISCDDWAQLLAVTNSFNGHLTASILASESDHKLAEEVLPVLNERVGRVIFNGYGTGVELSSAMSHGGPYPSSSASQTTSVGTRAIERFTRPVCFQNTPNSLLPVELRNENPNGIMRLVNDEWSTASIPQ